MDDLAEQPTRRRIREFILSHPGASAREIQRSLALAWGETSYHLRRLLDGGVLVRDRAGRRDYFWFFRLSGG
jgi:predicted transcriptional regulator